MRLQYPPDIKIILMPCTGRVDILHLLKAFEGGADAVFVAGCLEGVLWQGLGAWSGFGPSAPFLFGGALALLAALLMAF